MPDRMPDRMPEDMSDGMPEDMPDRMSEDLPVTKRINVMVGITRSKVIVFVYSSTVCGWLLAKVQHRLVLRHWACVPVPRTRPSILNDGKGNGLTCLAGHMPMVGTHEAICNMPRQRPAGGSQITRPAAIACACCVNPGSSHVLLCAPVPSRPTWCRLSPRWPGVRDDAVVCAWDQRSVSNRVWQQGQWANEPFWAHTEALAGQFTSSWLSSVLPWSLPRGLGGRLCTSLAHATLAHTTLLHTIFSHTTRSHSYTNISQLPHTQNACTHNCFTLIHHTVLTNTHTHRHNSSTYNCFLTDRSSSLLCLSFLPRPASTFVSNYWNKLTCGVIRSFNFLLISVVWFAFFHKPIAPALTRMFDAQTIGKLPVLGNDHQPINRDFSHGKESLMILEYPKATHHGLNIAHVIVIDCWRIIYGFP